MRKSTLFLILTGTQAALLTAALIHARMQEGPAFLQHQPSRALVRDLGLTDLCLFTEARYTRHPAMADRHAAFQDHPMGLEHFPSGSLVPPPSFASSPHAPVPAPLPEHP